MQEITTTDNIIEWLHIITRNKLNLQIELSEINEAIKDLDILQEKIDIEAKIKELDKKEVEVKNEGIKILQESWIDKFEANWVEVRIKTTAWSLIVTEQELIPKEFIKTTTKVTETVDKKKLKEAIMKDWEVIDWCKVEQKVSLEVKYK